MKIWLHRYQLRPRDPKRTAREGALVKVEWSPARVGYGDIHPWPEFGEPALDHHLEELRQLRFTPLVDRALEFTHLDADLRKKKRNAFLGLPLPRAHRLIADFAALKTADLRAWKEQGFTHVKVKMGRDLAAETAALRESIPAAELLWRIDFNGRLSTGQFTTWWQGLDPAVKARIDFVEDPAGDGELKITGPWANDWKSQPRAQIRVVKPVRERAENLKKYARVVFTHSLDHTFGQACALYAAAKFYKGHPSLSDACGLGGTDTYQDDDFSRAWMCVTPRLKPTPGLGFGFDDLLESRPWERL